MARLQSLADAVRASLNPGDSVAMEGFAHLVPFAAVRDAIRQPSGGAAPETPVRRQEIFITMTSPPSVARPLARRTPGRRERSRVSE